MATNYYDNAAYVANTGTNLSNGGVGLAWLAKEYLVKKIGAEAAQLANMLAICWVQSLIDAKSMTAHFRTLNSFTATSQTEGNGLSVVQFNPTGVTITAALEGLAVEDSVLLETVESETLVSIVKTASSALQRAIDIGALQQVPNMDNTEGTHAAALTINSVYAAISDLDTQFADQPQFGGYEGRLHPRQFENLRKDMIAQNYGINIVNVNGKAANTLEIGGVTFYKNALVATVNSGADYAGFIGNHEAIGIAMPLDPTVKVNYVPGYGTYSVDAFTAFGAGAVRPEHGCMLISGINS